MNLGHKLKCALPLVALLVVAGCGLATSVEERMARANEQVASGAYRAAMIELKNILASDSQHVGARLLLAEVSLGLGDIESAEKEMARAAEFGAAAGDVGRLNLRILAARNDHAAVLAALGMNESDLSDAERFSFRGNALLGLRNADAAAENYREWLASEPASADAAVGLARSIAESGDAATAIEQLQAVIADHPGHVDGLHALGTLYSRSGDYQRAAEALQNALAASKPQSNLRRHVLINGALVETQLALNDTENARTSLDRLSAITPQAPMTLFLAARLAHMEQDLPLAARFLQTLLNVSPDNRQAQIFLANVQMMQGHYAQAEVLLNRIVALSPDNVQARKLLAQVQVRQAQPQGAVEALAPLLEQPAQDADVYNLLAQIGVQQGDVESVIRNLREASRVAPDDLEIRLNLAAAYLQIDELALAEEALAGVADFPDRAFRAQNLQLSLLRAKNQYAEANNLAARLLREHADESAIALIVSGHFASVGEQARVRSVLSDFATRHADNAAVHIALGRLDIADGNAAAAESHFAAVLDSDTDNLQALLGLARVAELGGDSETTLTLLEKAARAHTEALAPRVWLASRYLKAGRMQEAETMAGQLTAIGYNNATVSEIVGHVLLQAGRLDEAIVQFDAAAVLDPDAPGAHLNVARAYLAADRTVEARAALLRALDLKPDWAAAKTLLTLVELRQGQAGEARRHVAELRALYPDDVSIMVLEGEVFLYQADFEGAAAAFNRAVQNGAGRRSMLREFQSRVNGRIHEPQKVLESWLDDNPDDIVARTTLGQYYLQSRNGEKAVREFEAVIRADPDNAAVLNNLAWQYQQLGDLQKTLETATRAFELDGRSGQIKDTLAWIYRDLGRLDESRELLNDATRLAPDNGEIRFHLATVLSETGNTQEARRLLEDLISSDARFPSRQLAEELLRRL